MTEDEALREIQRITSSGDIAENTALDVMRIIMEEPDAKKAVDCLAEEFGYLQVEFISICATAVEHGLRSQGLGTLVAFRKELANRWPNYQSVQSFLKS